MIHGYDGDPISLHAPTDIAPLTERARSQCRWERAGGIGNALGHASGRVGAFSNVLPMRWRHVGKHGGRWSSPNALPTRWQHVGETLEIEACSGGSHFPTRCQRVGGNALATHWKMRSVLKGLIFQRVANALPTRPQRVGNALENEVCSGGPHFPTRCQRVGDALATRWGRVGNALEIEVCPEGPRLPTRCQRIGDALGS